jgi:hypothetical protein
MPPTLEVGDCMEASAAYGVDELQRGMALIVSYPTYHPDRFNFVRFSKNQGPKYGK